MKPSSSRYRWYVVAVFFFFMLLHQTDKLLIGPLTTPIMETFGINEAQMGAVFTGALIVGAVFYPLWGYLYDRYARSKLLSAASFIWGSTTWLNAIAPTFGAFMVTRASTGIDDSSYPGLYSLISDYFSPKMRGKVYGILQLTQPLGYMLGMVLSLLLINVYVLGNPLGWRGIFYITGGLGIVLSVVIYFIVKEAPRGQSEPEMEGITEAGTYHFSWKEALEVLRKPSLRWLFIQGFFGVFPWNVITYWFFRYLQVERHYTDAEVFSTMVVAVLILAMGYPLGGALGDYFFKRTPRGRALVSASAVLIGAVLMYFTMNVPLESKLLFGVMLSVTAIFIPIAGPNVISIVYDVTLPEIRSSAMALESFIESAGAATAPLIAGWITVGSSLKNAIMLICISTWILCGIFFFITAYLLPKDVQTLRDQMRQRAEQEALLRPAPEVPGGLPAPASAK